MIRLEISETLQRKIRKDPVDELMIPTWTRIRKAIRAGKIEQGLELMEYAHFEQKQVHDGLARSMAFDAAFIVENFGEEQLEKMWRHAGNLQAKLVPGIKPQSLEEQIQLAAEFQRGHSCGSTGLGDATLVEETDRYVLTLAPCGTGGRMRKMGDIFGRTKKAYPWSWSQVGVPYYCTHCCVFLEILPIETYGYPVRINENPDWYGDPCIQIFYKSPELIPEHYFQRVGKKKDPSKFRKI